MEERGVILATLLIALATVLIRHLDQHSYHNPAQYRRFEVPTKDIFQSDFVVDLTEDNYDAFMKEHQLAFVHFYAPWATWCQRLAPTWDCLGYCLQDDSVPVLIAQVDCMAQVEVCLKENITAFPSMRWYRQGEAPVDYRSHRDVVALEKFITEQIANVDASSYDGLVENEEPVKDSSAIDNNDRDILESTTMAPEEFFESEFVVDLTKDNYDAFMKEHQLAFVHFYAPWAIWSQRLAPTWDFLGYRLQKNMIPVGVAQVDCMVQLELCQQKEKITAFPSMRWYRQGEAPVDYRSDRDVLTLEKFITEQIAKVGASSYDRLVENYEPVKDFSIEVLDDDWFDDWDVDWFDDWDILESTTMTPTNFFIDDESTSESSDSEEDSVHSTHVEEDMVKVDYLSESSDSKEDSVHSTHVFELTRDNSVAMFKKQPVSFVYFYGPLDPFSQRLERIWEQLAEEVQSEGLPLTVAKVNCTKEVKTFCLYLGTSKFPTLTWLSKYPTDDTTPALEALLEFILHEDSGKAVPEKYNSDQSVEALLSFAKETLSSYPQYQKWKDGDWDPDEIIDYW